MMSDRVTQPGHPENILIHSADNGMVISVPDGALRHAVNMLDNAFAFGVFGSVSPKNTVFSCERCKKVFARNVYAIKRGEQVAKHVAKGVLVWRYFPEQLAPAYDPTGAYDSIEPEPTEPAPTYDIREVSKAASEAGISFADQIAKLKSGSRK
jgi:hypothetical protein